MQQQVKNVKNIRTVAILESPSLMLHYTRTKDLRCSLARLPQLTVVSAVLVVTD